MHAAIDLFLHLDKHLNAWAGDLGGWTYGLLFLIIFCETGLVVLPLLPGDSLLFAVGALAASQGSPLSLPLVIGLLIAAAVLGDAVNYAIGKAVGPRVFAFEDSRWLNKEHLMRTHRFYEKHGGKTIVLARFMPIIRTFAPFVAGIGSMGYPRFALYNVTGGAAWVTGLVLAGYEFADLPIVKERFHLVILAIIGLSVLPIVIELIRPRNESGAA